MGEDRRTREDASSPSSTGGRAADDALAGTRRSVLGLLGLARRAGALRMGAGPVARALRDEAPGVVFLARDAGGDLAGRIGRAIGGSHLDRRLFAAEDLARAFGRQKLAVVSVHDPGFVAGLREHLSDTR